MVKPKFFSQRRITGLVLISSFVVFAIGATLPLLGKNGNPNIYTLPKEEYLKAVAANPDAWQLGNIAMGTAVIVLAVGFVRVTTLLNSRGLRTFSLVGMAGTITSGLLWVVFSAMRFGPTISAAQEMAATGTIPAAYEVQAQWMSALFYAYIVIGFIGLASYAVALLQSKSAPSWLGWGTLAYCGGVLAMQFATGDTLPAFHYIPPLVLGILLSGRASNSEAAQIEIGARDHLPLLSRGE